MTANCTATNLILLHGKFSPKNQYDLLEQIGTVPIGFSITVLKRTDFVPSSKERRTFWTNETVPKGGSWNRRMLFPSQMIAKGHAILFGIKRDASGDAFFFENVLRLKIKERKII